MKAKKIAIMAYVTLFIITVISCANTAISHTSQEYNNTIKMFKYQFSNKETYASKSVMYNLNLEQDLQVTTSEDEQGRKVAYLTFDDGPSPRTGEILDILAKHDIKATFFVIKPDNRKYDEYLKRAGEEGHTIGVHTATHKYKVIYESVQSYIDDFTICYDYIEEITGLQPVIFRFPGGSINSYNKSTIHDIIDETTRRGFIYFDWNVESNDSTGNPSASSIYNNVIKGAKEKENAVIIMHDSITRKTTVQALEDIIIELKAQGFEFATLDAKVKPVIFKLK